LLAITKMWKRPKWLLVSIFIRICSLCRGNSLWQFRIVHLVDHPHQLPTTPSLPYLKQLQELSFIVLFHMYIWIKQLLTDTWINKIQHMHTMEYHSVLRKGIQTHVTTFDETLKLYVAWNKPDIKKADTVWFHL
jgi:hypothetical protein